jgi:hypothetical protein
LLFEPRKIPQEGRIGLARYKEEPIESTKNTEKDKQQNGRE